MVTLPFEAMEYCRKVTRRRARNFYYGLKLAPEPYRSALFAVYAWMRRADDIVDDAAGAGGGGHRQIEQFRGDTEAALRGRPPGGGAGAGVDPLWVALSWVASTFRIDPASFHAMLDGQIEDLHPRRYETFEEMRGYCYRVASTVGLVCIEIWGYRDPGARALAVDRGIAFQLTNILRDYREDYDAGRIYLPVEDFRRHGIDPEALRHWEDPAACERLVLEQVARARTHYQRSAALEALITPSCRPTLWAMTAIYRGILEKAGRDPSCIVSDRRLRLSSWKKGVIALRAKWASSPQLIADG